MNADEFDLELEALEPENGRKGRMSPYAAKELVVRPDVARRLIAGESIGELSRELGVAKPTIRRLMQSFEMADLLDIEARRVMKHLSKRDLSKEKYLGLATAVAVMIDKSRGLRDGGMGSGFEQGKEKTIVQNISIALYGRGAGETGLPDRERLAGVATRVGAAVLGDQDQSAAGGNPANDLGGDVEDL